MDVYRIGIKLFLQNPSGVEREKFVPVFHHWIQEQGLSNHLLIDVADYMHVANAPGVVLVSHEANLSIDDSEGPLGLLYQRKRPFAGTFVDRLSSVFGSALEAAMKLENDPDLAG